MGENGQKTHFWCVYEIARGKKECREASRMSTKESRTTKKGLLTPFPPKSWKRLRAAVLNIRFVCAIWRTIFLYRRVEVGRFVFSRFAGCHYRDIFYNLCRGGTWAPSLSPVLPAVINLDVNMEELLWYTKALEETERERGKKRERERSSVTCRPGLWGVGNNALGPSFLVGAVGLLVVMFVSSTCEGGGGLGGTIRRSVRPC